MPKFMIKIIITDLDFLRFFKLIHGKLAQFYILMPKDPCLWFKLDILHFNIVSLCSIMVVLGAVDPEVRVRFSSQRL